MQVIVDLAGGLGNQLFCYSFGYAISQDKDAELVIDTSMQDNGIARKLEILNYRVKYDKRISYKHSKNLLGRVVFNKIRKKYSIGFNTKMYIESQATVYEADVLNISNSTYFKGNWQSEKYFKKYRNELLSMFVPVTERTNSVKKLCKKMQSETSIAVHIRRGDYIRIGCQLEMLYYDIAMEKIGELLKNKILSFYIFSDDVDFCKKYFSEEKVKDILDIARVHIYYPQYDSDNHTIDDLLLMYNCKHMIMANSSYSWWAAWLNTFDEKIVICPELGMWKGDFYPEEWIKVKM